MDAASLKEKFHKTKQDKEKLRIAVELCLYPIEGEMAVPEAERYLRLRQRPAAELLIRQGDLTGMRRLAACPWFERKYLPDYLQLALENGRPDFTAELLRDWYGELEQEIPGDKKGDGAVRACCGSEKRDMDGGRIRGVRRRAADKAAEPALRRDTFTESKNGDAGQMAREIFQLAIQSLLQRFPFIGGALLALEPVQIEGGAFGTDGERLCYDPDAVCRLFWQDPRAVESLALHSLFHCLFCHIFLPCGDGEREEADRAADEMVDRQLARMTEAVEIGAIRSRESRAGQKCSTGTARGDQDEGFSAVRDCHDFWPSRREGHIGAGQGHMEFLRQRWRRLAAGAGGGGMGAFHGQNGGGMGQEYGRRSRKARDYRRFLEQFMVRREERGLDMENFDPIWYHYSLSRYDGPVFLEPLETREVTRLEELLIAIDTSASCSGEVVEGFLDETFAILERQEHFFRKMNVHIVQCDCMIQDHVRITCESEWREYRRRLKIRGLGDTDFTPVFELAERLERTGQVKRLKGILYFTDGDGIFPRQAPPWPSAFVFLNRELEKRELPDWAIRLNLSERQKMVGPPPAR